MPVLRSCLAFVLLTLLTLSAVAEEGRTSLFNGKTLDGWVQKGGKASFVAKDGMIVGHSVPRLQVHGVGGREKPLYVRWRNLKITELN